MQRKSVGGRLCPIFCNLLCNEVCWDIEINSIMHNADDVDLLDNCRL